MFNETAMIGTTTSRVGNHTKKKEADPISAKSTPEAATFPTLFTNGTGGGFAHTDTGCTKNHYIHKTFGSVATHFCRAHEVKRQAHTHMIPIPLTYCALVQCSSCGSTSKTRCAVLHLERVDDQW